MKTTSRNIAILVSLAMLMGLGLGACAMPGMLGQHSVPFSDADFVNYVGVGPATLNGTALGRTRGGGVRTCAGLPVYLAPATAFVKDGIGRMYDDFSRRAVDMAAGPSKKYWRESACDAQGKFTFERVPAGAWYVLTSIEYEVAAAPIGGNVQVTERQGGIVSRKVVLRPGLNNIVLTQEDLKSALPAFLR